jgi:2-polyprenyl-6-methoxyphenol hydroxylase-like FAD-dependent oxidoreductase
MLANQLARRGVSATIIDRHPGPARETRALGVQARTLEIYAHLGIADSALALGKIANGANVWARGAHGRVPLGNAGRGVTPYPYILILGQDDNERMMGEHLRGLDVSVQWNTELTGMTQRPDGVEATVTTPEAARTLRVRWVAGATARTARCAS